MTETLSLDWQYRLKDEFKKAYFLSLGKSVDAAYINSTCFPPKSLLFEAFNRCAFDNVKVVLLGQDPYHGPGQAHGLSFSVPAGIKFPPSLRNVFKELQSDIPGYEIPFAGDLSHWAEQGVFLLNAILSVEMAKPGSHRSFGWEQFTDGVIHMLSSEKEHLVFLLWGNYAQSKKPLIDEKKHLVLSAAHPSPLARGAFFGSRPFSQTNAFLKSHGLAEINWQL